MTPPGESRRLDWPRVLLCGLSTGFCWHVLAAVVLGFFGDDFMSALARGKTDQVSPLFFLAVDLMMGTWAMWLYGSLRFRYSNRITCMIVVAMAWWSLKTLQSAKWAAIADVPWRTTLGPLVGTLPAILGALAVGCWLYDRQALPSASSPTAQQPSDKT